MRRFLILLAPVAIAGAVIAGCGGSDSKTVKIPGGGEVSISSKLPDNFPKDFPVYSGAKVKSSYTGKQDAQTGSFVAWETGDSVDKVKEFYNSEFAKGPWKATNNFDSADSSLLGAENTGAKKAATVTISRTGDTTAIAAFLGDSDTSAFGGSSSDATSSSGSSSGNKTATPDDSESSGNTPTSSGALKSPTSEPLPPEVKVSKDFPSDRVPLPSGARVTSMSSFGSAGSKTFSVEFYVKDKPDVVASFFDTELPKHGWASGFSSQSNGEYLSTFAGADANAASSEGVTISAADSDTAGYTKATIIVSTTGA